MGKIVTPTYRVEYRDNTHPLLGKMAWHGKQDGRANAANLENWRKEYNSSFQPGGSNWHIQQNRRRRSSYLLRANRAPARQ